jgi:hypothetical protein
MLAKGIRVLKRKALGNPGVERLEGIHVDETMPVMQSTP